MDVARKIHRNPNPLPMGGEGMVEGDDQVLLEEVEEVVEALVEEASTAKIFLQQDDLIR